MLRKFRLLSLLTVLVMVIVVASACQPIQAPSDPRPLTEIATELLDTEQSRVIDNVGPSKAVDPVQAEAENEFREVVLAREQAFYSGNADEFNSYYADDVISLEPGMPDRVGKEEIAPGIVSMFETTALVGEFTLKGIWVSGDYATRWGEWHEVTAPLDGGQAEHHIGRCMVAWQKINGEWKVVSQMVNMVQDSELIQ